MIRRRLHCRGTVQGVGFRPAVHRLARELELAGFVRNAASGAEIEVEGEEQAVSEFERRLAGALPKLARLAEVVVSTHSPSGEAEFAVTESRTGQRAEALIPPDARLCAACRADMECPTDRRYHYPFTTCTECGPRFSLVRGLPYDRARTSMAAFELCAACAAEYGDLDRRRYHAEALCCPECGPLLRLIDRAGHELACATGAMERARTALLSGSIVAIKGLGGYQLCCRADHELAIATLRTRKQRLSQPFAVMVRDLATARHLVELGEADVTLLESSEAPILLATRRSGAALAANLAPGLGDLGVMLPTTPLHVELFRDADYAALVMTSGNARHEPIARSDDEALEHLGHLAEFFLVHDREVLRRVDDSVARSCDEAPFLVRRSRGLVPRALPLPCRAPVPALALGGHLQVTACLAVCEQAIPSQHIGDLDTCGARDFLEEVTLQLEDFLEAKAEVIVVDEHPDYPSTWLGERLAAERGAWLLRIQHHLAHAAAVLAEHRALPRTADESVAALVLDGTGYGVDGTTWGCEWLVLDGALAWRRPASAEALELVGGERAVREPWRVALAALARAGALDLAPELRPEWRSHLPDFNKLLERGCWPRARGAGRLFEAAGALFGLCDANSWEGEAAARFEAIASSATSPCEPWPELQLHEGSREFRGSELLAAAAKRLCAGAEPQVTALGFHRTFASLAAELSQRTFGKETRTIALAGGCMVNRLLRRYLTEEHELRGFDVLLPRKSPAGDGGLSYGQAALAALALDRNVCPHYLGGV